MSLWTAIAQHCAASVPALTFDTDAIGGQVFLFDMPSQPDTSEDVYVAVAPYGGDPALTKQPTDEPAVQLRVRSKRFDPRPALAIWNQLYDTFAALDLTWIGEGPDTSFVISCSPLQSTPIPLGRDENDRPEFTLNLQFRVHNPTTHRPALT